MRRPALPGGISSSVRRLPELDGKPFIVERSAGPFLFGEDGRQYVDYALAMGATILGHAHPAVVEACARALRDGPMPGFNHAREGLAAEALASLAPGLVRATFVTTGSEAVHLACRIARKTTGRPVIAKIAGGFDGWYDDLALGWSGSKEADLEGPRPVVNGMTLLRFNDVADLEALLAERADIAAILIEPMLANAGSIRADRDYFRALRATADRHGVMIIADEVLMGMRLRCGPSSPEMGLQPDLVTLGKAIGSGLPVAAVLGTAPAFAAVEDGRAVRAGTYHGNPLVTAAVQATIETLRGQDYQALLARGDRLRAGIVERLAAVGLTATTAGFGSVFSLWFDVSAPTRYDEAKRAIRPDRALALHLALRRQGIVTIPGPWGRFFVSFAHGDAEIDRTLEAFTKVAPAIAAVG